MAGKKEAVDFFLFCDGASRGNPGPAAAGGLWLDRDETVVLEYSRALGKTTNNVAEYNSLILGLETLKEHLGPDGAGNASITVRMDSELVVKQIRGEYRVKNEALQGLHRRARALLAEFGTWRIEHVRRAENARADALANRALDG